MERESLTMHVRTEKGKSAVRKIAKDGFIPAVIYGHNKETLLAKLPQKEMRSISKHRGKAVFFVIEGGDAAIKGKKVIVKEIVRNPVSDQVIHIDFYEMSDKEMMKMAVPIKLKGKPAGVTNGGILEWEKRDVQLKALPEKMPGMIEVDVSGLNIGQSIHLSEIPLPAGVVLAEEGAISVATLVPPKVEVELTAEQKEAELQASLAEKEKTADKAKSAEKAKEK